jgi:hypothetical protein
MERVPFSFQHTDSDISKINWEILTPRRIFEITTRPTKTNENFFRYLRYTEDNGKYIFLTDIYLIYKIWLKVIDSNADFTGIVLTPKDLYSSAKASVLSGITYGELNFNSKRIWYNVEFTPAFLAIIKGICMQYPGKYEKIQYLF